MLQWVDDHSAWKQAVSAEVRSSNELQANDPSLGHVATSAAAAVAADDEEGARAVGGQGAGSQEEATSSVAGGEGGEASEEEEEGVAGSVRSGLQEISAYSGYHPSWGNYGDDSRGECGVPFAQRFRSQECCCCCCCCCCCRR